MKVKGLGSSLYDASKFDELEFNLPTLNGVITHIRRETLVVHNFDARILPGMDIVLPEGWIIDRDNEQLTMP